MISRIELLKICDALLGRFMAFCLPASRVTVTGAEPRRLLVIRPGGIGDAVLLVPALAAVKKLYPAADITVLAERRNAAIFDLCPAVDNLLLYDRPLKLLAAIRGRYDVVIDTEQWHRLSAVVARLAASTVKIGYGTNERARLFTHSIAYSHDDYEVVSFFRLLQPLGIGVPDTVQIPFLSLSDSTRKRAAELLTPVASRDYLVIFPGASIPERRWGADRFTELARRLERKGRVVVVVGGREDVAAGELIAGASGLNLAGRTALAETAAVMEGATLLVSGDSGILHIGVGLGVPTVSLFGPGRQQKWGPRGARHTVINHHLSCSPCTTFGTTPDCPYQVRCMRKIAVDEVYQTSMELLGEKNRWTPTNFLTLSD
jgi:lipopolysaccharide heptosyltransferase II